MEKELSDNRGYLPFDNNLRLRTLINIRWVAIFGQAIAVLVVWLYLEFQFFPALCLAVIGASFILNVFLTIRYPKKQRIPPYVSTILLCYDILQLSVLLYLTGGLQNPFASLMLAPVVISASSLPVKNTVFLLIVSMFCASFLVYYHFPLPWIPGETLELPRFFITGMWDALLITLSFAAFYAFRIADESRKLAKALSETELVLQREQYFSDINGLAAAAAHELGTPLSTITVVAKEMMDELEKDSHLYQDAELLHSQAQRCRQILKTLSSLPFEHDNHISILPITALVDEVAEPFRNFDVDVEIVVPEPANEPHCLRNPAIVYGLSNFLENAVDFAETKVVIRVSWNDDQVCIAITDDGPGYDEDIIRSIGEPFVQDRAKVKKGDGLGLGMFIAQNLLERGGAKLSFSNRHKSGLKGAYVEIEWPRSAIESQEGTRLKA